jgi:amidohydrolase
MDREGLKHAVERAIDDNREEIIGIGRAIFSNPELGFKEFKTSKLVAATLEGLGIPCREGIAITGVRGSLQGSAPRTLRIAVLGELDAVVCPLHPHADALTGAAHSCGHNAQIAAMLGVAIGLSKSGVMSDLAGDVVFMAVPAEEYVELEWRERLRRDGRIVFFGGKQEFIRLGEFDEVDMGMMVHSHAGIEQRRVLLSPDSSGFMGKTVRFSGREAHAGAAPFDGINALNAAALALMAINAQRETFREQDRIRVHPIITKGGDMVNIVPADVRLETYIRGRSMEAVSDANVKVDRALRAGAMAVGAEVDIQDIPGYLPLVQDPGLNRIFGENGKRYVGQEGLLYGYELMGATDAGDVSSLIPFMHPSIGGFRGAAHSQHFEICDEEMAYVIPAKIMALSVVDLLSDGAAAGRAVKEAFRPVLSKSEYLGKMAGSGREA